MTGATTPKQTPATTHPHLAILEAFALPCLAFGWRGEVIWRSSGVISLMNSGFEHQMYEARLSHILSTQLHQRLPRSVLAGFERIAELAAEGAVLRTELFLFTGTASSSTISGIALLHRDWSAMPVPLSRGITARESQVAHLIACGAAAKEIAREMAISEHTVRRHTEKLFAKHGVRSRAAFTRVWLSARLWGGA